MTVEQIKTYLNAKVNEYTLKVAELEKELIKNQDNEKLLAELNGYKWIKEDTIETYNALFKNGGEN